MKRIIAAAAALSLTATAQAQTTPSLADEADAFAATTASAATPCGRDVAKLPAGSKVAIFGYSDQLIARVVSITPEAITINTASLPNCRQKIVNLAGRGYVVDGVQYNIPDMWVISGNTTIPAPPNAESEVSPYSTGLFGVPANQPAVPAPAPTAPAPTAPALG